MKIGIDGYEANIAQRVGIGRFAFEVLWAMHRMDLEHRITVFIPNEKIPDLPPKKQNWEYRVISNRRLWTFTSLPKALQAENMNVFFSPTHYVPLFSKVPRVFSIMDLSFLRFPDLFRKKDLYQLRLGTSHSAKVAKKIITISQFSKDAIMEQYNISANRVTVAYPGFNSDIFNNKIATKKIRKVLSGYGVKDRYILYVGTLQPRKNIVRLLNAFQHLEDKAIKLLIVGKKGWLYKEFFEKIKKWKLADRILFTNFVSDGDLAALFAGAQCFVLPSLYEGFGIPVIEAMACGTPVVVSNVSSLPEVVGNAGIYVNPLESKHIAKGLTAALEMSEDQRSSLLDKGYKQIEKFSWEKCAEKIIETLENVYHDSI